MCIRDSRAAHEKGQKTVGLNVFEAKPADMYKEGVVEPLRVCLLYTSDAADDLLCVDLGGRRIIKQKKTYRHSFTCIHVYSNT